MSDFSHVKGLRCVSCDAEFSADDLNYTCPACGPVRGTLDVEYDIGQLRAAFIDELLKERDDRTLWRYHELLPVRDAEAVLPLPIEVSPLSWLAFDPGFTAPKRLLVKDDTRHPSGSSKDRATSVAVAHARELGKTAIAAASTGNAAASLAMFAARAGLSCYIFVPESAPAAKQTQIRAYGAHLFAVRGTYDDAFSLCAEVCAQEGFYNRNTATNPYLGEGKKTIALEIWEQLGFRVPETVIVPVGDGCILGGVFKGFRDLREIGLIPRLPRLIGVQAEGSAALATTWRAGQDACLAVSAETIADSLAVAMPRDQVKALRAVRESGGQFVTVSDAAICEAMHVLATRAGLFVEPAAAASLAGLKEAVAGGHVGLDDEVVLLLTGHGLKDIAAADRAAQDNQPIHVGLDLDEVTAALRP